MGRLASGGSDVIALALCSECRKQVQVPAGEGIASALLWSPVVPLEYGETHEICGACLTLRRTADRHLERCVLSRAGLRLLSGGWATACSEALRCDLRVRAPRWPGVTENVLTAVIRPYAGPAVVLVPVPISTRPGGRDGLLEATREVGQRLGLFVVVALRREKHRSTRRSVAQVRRQITAEEYLIDPDAVERIGGATVVLVDDNVTTGSTMSNAAGLLRASGAATIVPVALDRTISPRLSQRLAETRGIGCPHVRFAGVR